MSVVKEYVREYGESDKTVFIPTCDLCGDTLDNCRSFLHASEILRINGRKRLKVDGHYENYCPECLNLMGGKIK